MKKHELVKIQEQTLKVGLEWIAKVNLRCALDGCRYGYELFDKKPLDKCMYCNTPNPSVNPFEWLNNRGVSRKKHSASKAITPKKALK